MFEKIKAPFVWIADKWNKFEDWIYTWMPGWKTKFIAGIGAVGSAAAVMQDYITGLPLETWVSAHYVLFANVALFSMAYWFKRLADK